MGELELLQGTLDVMVLKILSGGPTHGYGIARSIKQRSGDVLKLEEGSLYPALHRLERRGLIESEWGLSENNRRAKFYTLTRSGTKHLEREMANWALMSEAVSRVLQTA